MKPVLRLPLGDLEEGERTLSADASTYVARVHRLGPGHRVLAFDPDAALEADGEIVTVGKRKVVVQLGPSRRASALPTRALTLVQAMGKGDKFDAIVRDATELGATRIIPAISEHSVRRPEAARVDRFRRIAVEAARQCGRGDAPKIDEPMSLADAFARAAPAAGLGLCLDPTASISLGQAIQNLSAGEPVVVVVGPEGGLSPNELDAASRHGFTRVAFGSFVLRTETVCAAVLGALLARG